MNDDRIAGIRQLIAEDEIEAAIEQLLALAQATGGRLADEAVLLSGRLRGWERRTRRGAEQDRMRAERATLGADALAFLNEFSRRMPTPPGYVAKVDLGQAGPVLEKLYGQAQLRHLAWLRRGLIAARAVCRVVAPGWQGSGFMLAGAWMITNWHVLPNAEIARRTEVEFNFEEDLDGRMLSTERYQIDPDSHVANEELDCARVRLVDRPEAPLVAWGSLEVERDLTPSVGDHVAIIQHPDGGPKKIAMGGNQIVNIFEHRLQYMTDTMPGSSGAPVFNDRWQVIGVHHAGGNLKRNSRGDRIYANEGTFARAVVSRLFP